MDITDGKLGTHPIIVSPKYSNSLDIGTLLV